MYMLSLLFEIIIIIMNKKNHLNNYKINLFFKNPAMGRAAWSSYPKQNIKNDAESPHEGASFSHCEQKERALGFLLLL